MRSPNSYRHTHSKEVEFLRQTWEIFFMQVAERTATFSQQAVHFPGEALTLCQLGHMRYSLCIYLLTFLFTYVPIKVVGNKTCALLLVCFARKQRGGRLAAKTAQLIRTAVGTDGALRSWRRCCKNKWILYCGRSCGENVRPMPIQLFATLCGTCTDTWN